MKAFKFPPLFIFMGLIFLLNGPQKVLVLPATPTGLALVPHVTTMDLTWTANTDDTTGYKIYYGTASNNLGTLRTVTNKATAFYTLTSLTPMTTYYVAITAFDANSLVGWSWPTIYCG